MIRKWLLIGLLAILASGCATTRYQSKCTIDPQKGYAVCESRCGPKNANEPEKVRQEVRSVSSDPLTLAQEERKQFEDCVGITPRAKEKEEAPVEEKKFPKPSKKAPPEKQAPVVIYF